MANITDTVALHPDGSFYFRCPSLTGCGANTNDPESRWITSGWPTAEIAAARGLQHINEHVKGELMQDLDEFRVSQGMLSNNIDPEPVDLTAYLPEEN